MYQLRLLLLALACSLLLACRSNPAADGVPCTCGTPEADLEGCAHMKCLKGERNPENPECVCGGLKLPG